MATKVVSYVIEVNTANGKVKIDGITKGFVQADLAAKKLNTTLKQTNTNLGQGASKAGLAGATLTELGRTISDSNYGLTAMANNMSQLSTLMITLISTTGGLKNALKLLGTQLMGPLGLIIAFQLLITIMESAALEDKKAIKTTKQLREETEKLVEAIKERNEASRYHVENTKEIVRLEEQLEDVKLYDPDNWRKIAAIRTELIDKELILLKAQKASVGDILSPKDLLKLNSDIYKLEQERSRVLSEEFAGREKDKGLSFGLMGLTPQEMDLRLTTANDLVENERILEAQRTAQADAAARGREIIAYREAEVRKAAMMEVGFALQDLGVVFGEETATGKALAVAGALINTYLGATKALSTGGFLGIAQAAAVITFGLAQVKQILDVQVPGKGGSGSGGNTAEGDTVTPQFNIIGASGPNRIAEAVNARLDRPVRAYVTTKDIRSGEELARNTRSGATL